MAVWHSKHQTVLVGKESTYGTPVTADKDIGLIQSLTPSDKRTQQKLYTAGSRTVQEIVSGLVEFDFDANLFLQNGRVFEYLLGAPTHAETTGDWKHTFNADTSLSSFTLEDSFNGTSDNVFIYEGCKFLSGSVTLEKDGVLSFAGTGKAQSVSTATASASAAVISNIAVLHFKHAAVSTGTADSEVSVGKVQTFNVSFANTSEPIAAAGNIDYQEIVEQNFDATFDFTMMFENLTEYKKFLGGTSDTPQTQPASFSTVFNANNGTVLGSGRLEFNAQIDANQYEEVGTPVNVGEAVVQSFRGGGEDINTTDKVFYVDTVSSANFS